MAKREKLKKRRWGGKAKGSLWEREVCRWLSLWLSKGESKDYFWRSQGSGSRATRFHKVSSHNLASQAGDIACTTDDPTALAFIEALYVECKFWKRLRIDLVIYHGFGHGAKGTSQSIGPAWKKAIDNAAAYRKVPILIIKENQKPALLGCPTWLSTKPKPLAIIKACRLALCKLESLKELDPVTFVVEAAKAARGHYEKKKPHTTQERKEVQRESLSDRRPTFTDRPMDDYRWSLFQWLAGQKFDALIIAGDLTNDKDLHSGQFVNRVVDELLQFVDNGREVHVLVGNHDYSDPKHPFFRFLSRHKGCYYYHEPQMREIGNVRFAFFPHRHDPEVYAERMQRCAKVGVDFIVCHQVMHGAVSETDRYLRGWRPDSLGTTKIFAGDVHVPQQVGDVEYVGAPYPIRFGDTFEPRVVMIDGATRQWDYVPVPHMQKLVLEIKAPKDLEWQPRWKPGDQVKVILHIARSEFGQWETYRREIKRICEQNELVLCGITLKEVTRERLDDTKPKLCAFSGTRHDQFAAYCKNAKVDGNDRLFGVKLLET